MKIAYRKQTVNIPVNALSHEVQAELTRLTRQAGGMTVHSADGFWYDDDKCHHIDQLRVYSWALRDGLDMVRWGATIRNLYRAMFSAGEQTVYIEQHNEGNFMACIVYPSDVEQDSEH